MKITVNGAAREVAAEHLATALVELGYGDAKVATAVNEVFVPSGGRAEHKLAQGDRLEILSAKQGG